MNFLGFLRVLYLLNSVLYDNFKYKRFKDIFIIKAMKREQIIKTIKGVLSEHGVKKAYLFGSFARKEKFHDIDIAIELPKRQFSLLDLVGVEQELKDETGKNVDVVILRSIKPRLRAYIEKDLTAIL
jgi:predicted nucleotidyltransferase